MAPADPCSGDLYTDFVKVNAPSLSTQEWFPQQNGPSSKTSNTVLAVDDHISNPPLLSVSCEDSIPALTFWHKPWLFYLLWPIKCEWKWCVPPPGETHMSWFMISLPLWWWIQGPLLETAHDGLIEPPSSGVPEWLLSPLFHLSTDPQACSCCFKLPWLCCPLSSKQTPACSDWLRHKALAMATKAKSPEPDYLAICFSMLKVPR